MTISAYPAVGRNGTDVEFSRLFNIVLGSGTYDPDTLKVTADGGGMRVFIAAGIGTVRGHVVYSTATEEMAIVAADTLPRIDTIVAQLDYTKDPIIQFKVIKGTAATTPAAPSLTQSETGVYEMPLANVAVAGSAVVINTGAITDRRRIWEVIAGELSSGTLPISNGGTGATTASAARTALGAAANTHTHAAADTTTGVFPISRGGTGAGNAADARTALGAAAASHDHSAGNITSGTLPLTRGGTGGTSAATARTALGVPSTSEVDADLAGKSNTGHNHDERYYTETEINTALAGKASTSHTHSSLISGDKTLTRGGNSWDVNDNFYAAGYVEATGEIRATGLMRSAAAYGNDIGGTRRAMWMATDGTFGFASSSEALKANLRAFEIDPHAILDVDVFLYERKAQIAQAKKDKTHHVMTELGMMAERLHAAGLWPFVIYEEGAPIGIHYELWGMAVHIATQFIYTEHRALSARVDAFEARLAALDGK